VSPQVCAETRSVAVRKLGISTEDAAEFVIGLLPWCTAPQTGEEIRRALQLVARWRMGWWDALILASAIGARCTHLLSADGQSAGANDGVTYVDPFRIAPADLFGRNT
jgi:predicted nucleic acid-binding protein